jgi:hypothetical protein
MTSLCHGEGRSNEDDFVATCVLGAGDLGIWTSLIVAATKWATRARVLVKIFVRRRIRRRWILSVATTLGVTEAFGSLMEEDVLRNNDRGNDHDPNDCGYSIVA